MAEQPPVVRTYTISATDKVLITGRQTNADRIRSMTDEELANFLMDVACRGGIQTESGIARWTLIDWLKRGASE